MCPLRDEGADEDPLGFMVETLGDSLNNGGKDRPCSGFLKKPFSAVRDTFFSVCIYSEAERKTKYFSLFVNFWR